METYDLTQEQLAERVGKSRSQVANMLRALTAPQALQDAVVEGKISEGHLRALLPLPLSDAITALGEIIARELSVRYGVPTLIHVAETQSEAMTAKERGFPTVVSYLDTVSFGFQVCPDLVPDVAQLARAPGRTGRSRPPNRIG